MLKIQKTSQEYVDLIRAGSLERFVRRKRTRASEGGGRSISEIGNTITQAGNRKTVPAEDCNDCAAPNGWSR